jgi:hypothetical protein
MNELDIRELRRFAARLGFVEERRARNMYRFRHTGSSNLVTVPVGLAGRQLKNTLSLMRRIHELHQKGMRVPGLSHGAIVEVEEAVTPEIVRLQGIDAGFREQVMEAVRRTLVTAAKPVPVGQLSEIVGRIFRISASNSELQLTIRSVLRSLQGDPEAGVLDLGEGYVGQHQDLVHCDSFLRAEVCTRRRHAFFTSTPAREEILSRAARRRDGALVDLDLILIEQEIVLPCGSTSDDDRHPLVLRHEALFAAVGWGRVTGDDWRKAECCRPGRELRVRVEISTPAACEIFLTFASTESGTLLASEDGHLFLLTPVDVRVPKGAPAPPHLLPQGRDAVDASAV